MDKKRIGIKNNYDSNWIAGKYYLNSISEVLKQNPNNEVIPIPKPTIIYRVIRKVFGDESRILSIINQIVSQQKKLDFIYPCERYRIFAKNNIYWIPDFQENYYPSFFSIQEICSRLTEQVKIAYSSDILVLSSESAKNDFKRLYPKYTCQLFVLPFISSLYGQKFEQKDDILVKYSITKPYFICSNQFWKHKNHYVVINAAKYLVEKEIDFLILFTGKENDYRNPDYSNEIKQYVLDNKLEKNVKFLGFIPRDDQVNLIINSIAVIQPSYFEGWNTTIEDSKYLHKRVIASNLPVHKEQLGKKGYYFDCDDFQQLGELILEIQKDKDSSVDYSYEKEVQNYQNTIEQIFK